MSYYQNNSQLNDNSLLTGLMFITGSIVGGSILYFIKPTNDCPVVPVPSIPSETSQTSELSEANQKVSVESETVIPEIITPTEIVEVSPKIINSINDTTQQINELSQDDT